MNFESLDLRGNTDLSTGIEKDIVEKKYEVY
jgi:hypothetical protein